MTNTTTASSLDAAPKLSSLALVSFGHFVNDTYSSFIYPLLPLMADRLHLSMSQAFWLIPFFALVSSLLQPVYGMISDRYVQRSCAVFGPLVAALGLSAIGQATSYRMLIATLLLGGIGVGMFHPQAAAMAARSSGNKRRIGMAIFSAVGTLGLAFGPFVVTQTVERFGLDHTWFLSIGGVLTGLFLFCFLPPLERPTAAEIKANAQVGGLARALQMASGPLLLLYSITVLRAGTQLIINSYYPFLLKESGQSLASIGHVLTVFLFAGGVGGLTGGFLAERFGGRAVTLYSGLLAGPLLVAAFVFPGTTGLVFLAAGGFALVATIPVNVAMAQELVPQRTATVSALMMGFAWGLGSLAPRLAAPLAPYLGGYRGVMMVAALVTFGSTALAYCLPRETRTAQTPKRSLVTSPTTSLVLDEEFSSAK